MKILVLGGNGMLGHILVRQLLKDTTNSIRFTTRGNSLMSVRGNINFSDIDVMKFELLESVLDNFSPDVIINCIGIIKQVKVGMDPRYCYPVNSIYPQKLSILCGIRKIRLIHISTDCVFLGTKGNYMESDTPDAIDVYGISKYLGEVHGPRDLTLRTSLIGPELGNKKYGLLEWFLSNKMPCNGYSNAIFNGLTTLEFSKVLINFVLPNPSLKGLYHVSSETISKSNLLYKIAEKYKIERVINEINEPRIDRSLDSSKFRVSSGYMPIGWDSMIESMYIDHSNHYDL